MIPVVTVSHELASPAALSLRAEGVDFAEKIVASDEFAYGRMLERLWKSGRGFVLVEGDIAPWPGAIDRLRACSRSLCVHRYHFWTSPKDWGLGYSLGLVKVSAGLTKLRELDPAVPKTAWNELDSLIWRTTFEGLGVHVHEPGVAHVRSRFDG